MCDICKYYDFTERETRLVCGIVDYLVTDAADRGLVPEDPQIACSGIDAAIGAFQAMCELSVPEDVAETSAHKIISMFSNGFHHAMRLRLLHFEDRVSRYKKTPASRSVRRECGE